MRHIQKNSEPKKLVHYRQQKFVSFVNMSPKEGKDDIQNSLLDEQGFLCAYCMRRIDKETIRIEHWKSQDDFPESKLDYKNMLGVCQGKYGVISFCEQDRGNKVLTINPLDKLMIQQIRYSATGKIFSTNSTINDDIDKTLKLNLDFLKKNREKVWEGVETVLGKGEWDDKKIKKELEKWKTKSSDNTYKEYCEVVVYFLEKRLNSK